MKTTTLKNTLVTLLFAATAILVTSCASGGSGSSLGGAKSYPLKTCIVTDNDLGSMGDEQRLVYQGQELLLRPLREEVPSQSRQIPREASVIHRPCLRRTLSIFCAGADREVFPCSLQRHPAFESMISQDSQK